MEKFGKSLLFIILMVSTIGCRAYPTQTAHPLSLLPKVNVLIRSCATGIDVMKGLGEVTNVYVVIQNVGGGDASNLTITLSASDEDQMHPDKSYQLQHLPAGYEIVVKLTVDTQNNVETEIEVYVVGDPGVSVIVEKGSCSGPNLYSLGGLISEEGLFSLRKIEP
jgi:hypothetical protein